MKIYNRATAVALILASTPLAAASQLETIVVRAAREPIAAEKIGSSVTVLTEDLLRERQTAPLGEILRSVPGVAVSRVGVMGSQTQLRLRGSEANHVLVFIDGIKVNDPAQNSEFNMAHLLNYDIESVEVIRGPQSALWGSDALAGVINITTRRAGEGLRADAYAEGGSNSWQNYGASGAWADDRWQLSLSANSLETDGENISRSGGEDDGYDNQTVNAALAYEVSEAFRLEGKLRYTDASNDFDGVDFNTGLPADSNNETDVERLYGRLAAKLDTLGGRWRHELYLTEADTDNKNRSENGFAPTGFDTTNADADVTTYGYQTSFALTEDHLLTAAIEREEEDFKQRGPVGFGDPNRDEDMDTDSFIVEYRGDLTQTVSVLASLRHDDNSDFDDKTTGRLSGAWRINDGTTKLRAAWGKGIKNPTFTERYGYFTDFIGNPDLEPEESTGWEIGVDQRLLADRLSLSLTWFDEELEDEINGFVYDPENFAFTADNEDGKSQREGIELSSAWLISEALSLNLAYTWLDATEEDDFTGQNTDEIRRPEHIASANLNWSFMGGRANLNLNVDYNGEQDDFFFPPVPPYQERVELDDFTLVSLAGSFQLSKQLKLFGRVENALDEDYEEAYGYVAPGSSAYFGVSYSLGK
jgi:vitamin B12 transporter